MARPWGVGFGGIAIMMFVVTLRCLVANGQTGIWNLVDETVDQMGIGATGTRRAVPAVYIFGDSTADSGNNNKMATIARSNYPPYGREFDTRHATGRFSNGRMTSDFITAFMRIPIVPPYLSPEADMYNYQGANFASAGAGILNQTGNVLGAKISGWEQIELFLEKRDKLVQLMGEENAAKALRHSIFYFATGGNDYIHNYVTNDTDAALLPHEAFNALLLTTFEAQLKTLFYAGARKIVVLGIGPVGCAPHFLWATGTTTGECMTKVNGYVSEYNDGLRTMIGTFNEQNRGAHVIYRDIYNVVYQLSKSPLDHGFLVGSTACCGAGPYGGGNRCLTPLMACSNPSQYVWWDLYHPSHRANHFIASQIWNGVDPAFEINTPAPSPSTDTGGLSNSTMRKPTITFMTLQQLALLDLGDTD